MTLRTPRRRISPQTRRRCRAIKGFFKRALGSLSQPDLLEITSSIAVNVTDINHKIGGLEQQLNEVCKTCRDNLRDNHSVRTKSSTPLESRNVISQRNIASGTKLKGKETKIIYAKSENQYKNSVQSDYAFKTNNETNRAKSANTMNVDYNDERVQQLKKKKSKIHNRGNDYNVETNNQNNKTESSHTNIVSAYSTSSFHSLDEFRKMCYTMPGFSGNVEEKKKSNKIQNDHHTNKTHRKLCSERIPREQYEEKVEHVVKDRKTRHNTKELDPDFIADIIRRQYKPVKFGRKTSDLSQFSAPVCNDREFSLAADCYNIPEEHLLCNCGRCPYNRFSHHSDCSDIKSVCDARLYNVKRNPRTKHRRRQVDAYDNSDIYDLVPVKEKSSPKSRRKFMEDSMRSAYYKEVPPSPRTHRPQLNLKTRYAESDCDVEFIRKSGKRISSKYATRECGAEKNYQRSINRNNIITPNNTTTLKDNEFRDHYNLTEIQTTRSNINNEADGHRTNSIMSGNYPILATENFTVPVETPLNKTQETISSDKTDKALGEIKDILQSFLLEIKKEASSHNQKSDVNAKTTESGNSPLNNANTMTSTRHSFSNFNSAHCPVAPSPFISAMPTFGNTCCYPLMPICPVNCMQNSYPMPSTSFTHNSCVDKSNETCNTNNNNRINANESCETDELIKEIYKFVSQSPTFCRKSSHPKGENDSKQIFRTANKVLTSRSVGGSTRIFRHDAKVGTPKTKCVSKSCEAIKMSDVYSSDTNASYSDTVLDKLSLEATQSTSETESSTEVSQVDKVKRSKFAKVLKSIGLSKKIKKDVIEELSESESTTVETKKKPPFQQHVTDYAIHTQEYRRQPPVSPHYRPEYPQDYRPPYNPTDPYWDPRLPQSRSQGPPPPQYRPGEFPPVSPYSQRYESYHQMQPQVPLCLKEIEVKSIGCQSERKLSFFRKITQKMQPPARSVQDDTMPKNGSTQTPQIKMEKPRNGPGLFNWKNPQPKFMDTQINPLTFGLQTQKNLAQGDMKLRNAMLKKMFYKKNPFSPRNLIVRTLMGKDKSSFGEPRGSLRPRMFM